MQLLIYAHHTTPRLQYMVAHLGQQWSVAAQLTTDADTFIHAVGPKINYSNHRLTDDELHLCPAGLLQESGIRKQELRCFNSNGTVVMFPADGDLGYDPLAAIFYCITRYEEYLAYEPDAFGRYAHWNSIAWKQNFLQQPQADQWLLQLGALVEQRFPGSISPAAFSFQPTYDIDMAWSYRHKPWWRTAGALLRNPTGWKQRLRVLTGRQTDPFDSFQWLEELHQGSEVQPIYFFLVAPEQEPLDKNISVHNSQLQSLIRHTSRLAKVGLHPSLYSNTHPASVLREKQLLEQISGQTVTSSRHHFLRIHLPHSYRVLINCGITDDYTMGYGTVNGFRASTARSFQWYDLEAEAATSLRIHPFGFMEATSLFELQHTPEQALEELFRLTDAVKNAGGTMISIFHNHFLGTDPMFAGWREMYTQFLASLTTRPAAAG